MVNWVEQVNITENLLKVFNYAFVETAPYGFYIPRGDQYVETNLVKKIYHCLCCDQTITVDYNRTGTVHFSKARFEKQRKVYEKRALPFPSDEAVRSGAEFVSHEEGYCCNCVELIPASGEGGQRIYGLCQALHRSDVAVLGKARTLMSEQVKRWIETIEESAQLAKYDLSSYIAIKDLICAVILDDLKALEACLAAYRADVQTAIREIGKLLAVADDTWEAYAARPMTIYESMSDELYHEYTVAFPVKETIEQEFYVHKKIDQSRVRMFLEQTRVQTIEELIMEAGFMDRWVDWFIDHVTVLKK